MGGTDLGWSLGSLLAPVWPEAGEEEGGGKGKESNEEDIAEEAQ